jgi:hypothetical protein
MALDLWDTAHIHTKHGAVYELINLDSSFNNLNLNAFHRNTVEGPQKTD